LQPDRRKKFFSRWWVNESKTNKIVNAVPLEEQIHPDFPEDEELEDDIEDLLTFSLTALGPIGPMVL